MEIILALHNGESWNLLWRNYCEENNLSFIELDFYRHDIINVLKDKKVTHLMWHFNHAYAKDLLMARNVLFSAKKMNIKVFPDFDTSWHFDDKISQKYLLEAVNAPIVPTWAFYDLATANNWLERRSEFPLVAKLRRGAGSYNVRLLKDLSEARKYTLNMFDKGENPSPTYVADIKNRVNVLLAKKNWKLLLKKLKSATRKLTISLNKRKEFSNEKGYVYFQKFIEGNTHDLRVIIVGDRAWGFHRAVRKNDFRASGSKMTNFEMKIPIHIIELAFDVSKKLNLQSIAYDFVMDREGNYHIVEMSYGFGGSAYYSKGYWSDDLTFHPGKFYPEVYILERFLSE